MCFYTVIKSITVSYLKDMFKIDKHWITKVRNPKLKKYVKVPNVYHELALPSRYMKK